MSDGGASVDVAALSGGAGSCAAAATGDAQAHGSSSRCTCAGAAAAEATLLAIGAEVERCLGAVDIARRDLDAAALRVKADRIDLDARAAIFSEARVAALIVVVVVVLLPICVLLCEYVCACLSFAYQCVHRVCVCARLCSGWVLCCAGRAVRALLCLV
jgi:hypothetical protein